MTAYDDETPGVVVQETDGSTVVDDDGATDSYRVRLTRAPASDVTDDAHRPADVPEQYAAGFQVVDESGDNRYFEYSFTFTPANWHDWVVMKVRANPAFAGTDSVFKTFPPQDQNLDQIRGPLIIEGGIGSQGADRSLHAPVLLPNETDSPSIQESSDPRARPTTSTR